MTEPEMPDREFLSPRAMLAIVEQNGELRNVIASGLLDRKADPVVLLMDVRDAAVAKAFKVDSSSLTDHVLIVVIARTAVLTLLRSQAPDSARIVAGDPPAGQVWIVAFSRSACTVGATFRRFDRHMPQAHDPLSNPN